MGLTNHLIWRYFTARRGFTAVVTGFSLMGIMLGVAALIVVMAVMSGFQKELVQRILGMTGHITITEAGLTLPLSNAYLQRLQKLEGVKSGLPYVQGQGLLIAGNRSSGTLVKGLQPKKIPQLIQNNVVEGALNTLEEKNTIAIGNGLASQLNLQAGSYVTLLSPQGLQTPFGFMPRLLQAKVGAVFNVGMYQYDNGLAVMNLSNAQKFFNIDSYVSAIDIYLHNPQNLSPLLPQIINQLNQGAYLTTWEETNREFFQALNIQRLAMFIILTLIILVAAFNIITGQMMLVNSKKADIAILRTMGATKNLILKTFLLNGLLIGSMGTVFGLILGVSLSLNLKNIVTFLENTFGIQAFPADVYLLSELPVHLIPQDVAVIVAMSLVLSIFASLLPAWRAAKMDPVEILRNE